MKTNTSWRAILASDTGLLVLFALAKLILHVLTNNQYGFHRDELATLSDARYLAWGYVAYPPLAPFLARIELELFGPSLAGVRLFSALSLSVAIVLAGLMAREMGGRRGAMFVAAIAAAIAPISFLNSTLYQYVAFDYLAWVAMAYFAVRLIKSRDPRWWLAIGLTIGLGALSKYTIVYGVAGLVAGVLLTPQRRYLTSPWLWGGVLVAVVVALPNLIWQFQHGFISLEMLAFIHARDIAIGRTEKFLPEQLYSPANFFTIPLWIAGLWFYFRAAAGAAYRLIGWMAVVPFVLFWVSQGRGYYTGPIYPMLLAAGAVQGERWVESLSPTRARWVRGVLAGLLIAGAALLVALGPYAPLNSGWWNFASEINTDMKEEIGWPEFVAAVAQVYNRLPESDRARTAILAGNYGEAGAIDLYGPTYGLPAALSGVNSYWLRGYGDPPPEVLIITGVRLSDAQPYFRQCELASRHTNPYGVRNEEAEYGTEILLCRELVPSWPEFWQRIKSFG